MINTAFLLRMCLVNGVNSAVVLYAIHRIHQARKRKKLDYEKKVLDWVKSQG